MYVVLAERKLELAEEMPNVSDWERYFSDADVKAKFEDSLQMLENASDEIFSQLEINPGKSVKTFYKLTTPII